MQLTGSGLHCVMDDEGGLKTEQTRTVANKNTSIRLSILDDDTSDMDKQGIKLMASDEQSSEWCPSTALG
ncbi:hypothetical protein Y032_0700g1642 [Ancylostoma ceylanicum]|uniref:Uncharacterized protein n=1 Tax=Ancylostoma ceylanicum TaxID=53326 RepID=A0A016WGF6_9BILA|nr:hypothetical protein Y032_0700g1642 [Ancylostoma ceylanicum]